MITVGELVHLLEEEMDEYPEYSEAVLEVDGERVVDVILDEGVVELVLED